MTRLHQAQVRDVHDWSAMTAVPFLVYFVAIAAAWYVLLRILPSVLSLMLRVGRVIARGITKRGYLEKWLSFLPESLLRLKPYGTLILIVLAGSGVAFVAGDQFFDMAERLRAENRELLRIDQAVHGWTQQNRYDMLTPFYLTFTIVGNPLGLTLLLLIGIAISLVRREWSLAIYLPLTSGMGGLLNRWLKALFGRERPDLMVALSDAAHQSFPSGHAMGSVIVLGALAYAAIRLTASWPWKSFWVAAALVTAFTIALSRIYLGVHWISDIAAGFAAGLSWLLTSIVVFEGYRQVKGSREKRLRSE